MYTRLWVCECVSVWPRQLDVSYNVRGSTFLHGIETCEAPRLAVNRPTDTHTHTYDNYRMPHMCATSAACRDRTRVRVRDQSRKWIFRFHVVTIASQNFRFAVSLEKLLGFCWSFFLTSEIDLSLRHEDRLLTIHARVHINKKPCTYSPNRSNGISQPVLPFFYDFLETKASIESR